MIAVRSSGGTATIAAIAVRDGSGLNTIATASLRDGSGLSTVFSTTQATGQLTPSSVTGYGYSKAPITVTTDEATVAAPSGATVVWNFNPPTAWSAVSPNATTTQFRRTTVGQNMTYQTQVTATVISGSRTYTTNAITAIAGNSYGGNDGTVQ